MSREFSIRPELRLVQAAILSDATREIFRQQIANSNPELTRRQVELEAAKRIYRHDLQILRLLSAYDGGYEHK